MLLCLCLSLCLWDTVLVLWTRKNKGYQVLPCFPSLLTLKNLLVHGWSWLLKLLNDVGPLSEGRGSLVLEQRFLFCFLFLNVTICFLPVDLLAFKDRVPLCSSDWLQTGHPPASSSQVLSSESCAAMCEWSCHTAFVCGLHLEHFMIVCFKKYI